MVPSQRHAAVSELTQFLDGHLPESTQIDLVRHLETCASCQQQLQQLSTDGSSWNALDRYLKGGKAGPSETLRQAVTKLRDQMTYAGPTLDGSDKSMEMPLTFLDPPTKPNQLGVFDRYEILQEVGRGGRGIVFKAFDPVLQRLVALKVIAPQFAALTSVRQRFVREAQAAAAVCHDYVVPIYAVAESKGLPYLVMQFIAGVSLQEYLEKSGPLPVEEILRLGIQIAQGLAAAHAQGLVHRDIKPANILLESGVGRVKITDFGLARSTNDASITQVGTIVGTPQYMAPEQARGEPVDGRADLFSLGGVVYFMATGQPPFQGSSPLSVLRKVCDEVPPPLSAINPSAPKWLVEIVARLQAKEPADRFQTAVEVAVVLAKKYALLRKALLRPAPAPPAPPARSAEKPTLSQVQLVLYRKTQRVWTKQLSGSQATLGRGQNCTIRIPSSDVSRTHCRLRMEADGLVRAEDLESANGTFINGAQIHGLEIVRPGDRLALGPVTFVVKYEMTTKKASPPRENAPEKIEEKPSVLGEAEEIRLPDNCDLRDFLREEE